MVEVHERWARGRLTVKGAERLSQFLGRLMGKSDGQSLVREGGAGQQDVREAGGQDAGFARTGGGEHQQRPVHGFHRGALFGELEAA